MNSSIVPSRFRVFIASPGDVSDERSLAMSVIRRINSDPLLLQRIIIEPIAWDTPGTEVPMLASMTPHQAISKGLPEPAECDIVVVILWSRMGTPLPNNFTKKDGSRYLSGTEWEFYNALDASKQGEGPEILLYRCEKEPTFHGNDPDILDNIQQWNLVKEFFSSLRQCDSAILNSYNTYTTGSDFERKFEFHLREIIKRLLQNSNLSNLASHRSTRKDTQSPYPGLRAFSMKEENIYFGRGYETDRLIERVANGKFTAVVGASGSGKSSLVSAGLIPRLLSDAIPGTKDWLVATFSPSEYDGNPYLALSNQLIQLKPTLEHSAENIASSLMNNPGDLRSLVDSILSGRPHWSRLLIFIDQFEEFFTVVRPGVFLSFLALLEKSIEMERIHIVVTLRADFYHRCLLHPELAEVLNEGSFPLGQPGPGALYEVITRPAQLCGLVIENGLIDIILNDAGSGDGLLPLLAYTLYELYEKRTPQNTLTHDSYDSIGGIKGAIAKSAVSTFELLDTTARECLPALFAKLVDFDERGTASRKRMLSTEFNDRKGCARLIDVYTKSRLLVQDKNSRGEPIVQLAHESLLDTWPQLVAWKEEMRDVLSAVNQIQHAVQEWINSDRKAAYLWPPEKVELIKKRVEYHFDLLNEDSKSFLLLDSERDSMYEELERLQTDITRRIAIGERVCRLKDSRPGVLLTESGLPDIAWCKIPAGKVLISKTNCLYTFEAFEISKYPITRAQFTAYLRESEKIDKELDNRQENLPIVNITWYDAYRFCQWLSDRLGTIIRLPYESEWQYAAASGNKEYLYPWGATWNKEYTNTTEERLKKVIAVGLFPQNACQFGVLDMVGNIWEWCIDSVSQDSEYLVARSDNDILKVIRGGSWRYNYKFARSTTRLATNPYRKFEDVGFRIVRSPSIPERLD